jgi:hypothetical protein
MSAIRVQERGAWSLRIQRKHNNQPVRLLRAIAIRGELPRIKNFVSYLFQDFPRRIVPKLSSLRSAPCLLAVSILAFDAMNVLFDLLQAYNILHEELRVSLLSQG